MTLGVHVERFLQTIEEAARGFSGLRVGDDLVPLVHPFWNPDEIAKGRAIKIDWGVPSELVPFYGDWHNLLCISVATGEVVFLDDDRTTLFAWKTRGDFLSCLTTHPEMGSASSAPSGVIEDESWLDF